MATTLGRQAYLAAKALLGTPYVFGGEGPPGGVDCSRLVQYGWGKVGVVLPRTSEAQAEDFQVTGPYDNGDLLFFRGALSEVSPGHVGFFAGYGVILPGQHAWVGSGNPKTGKLIILNAPFTGDVGGVRFDYAPSPVLFHTRPHK